MRGMAKDGTQQISDLPAEKDQATPTPKPDKGDDSTLRIIEGITRLNAAAKPAGDPAKVYELIADDKPLKLAGSQVGFERGKAHDDAACRLCWHYVQFTARARKKLQTGACEVVRPEDGNPSVEPNDYCHFAFSPDGVEFPMRNVSEQQEASSNSRTEPRR